MKKNHLLPALICVCCHLQLPAQESNSGIPQPQRERVDLLLEKMKREVFPLPLPGRPCRLTELRNETREMPGGKPGVKNWLEEAARMREAGDQHCALDLLDELEPAAKKNDDSYSQWLYEKSRTLSTFVHYDSALVVARQLRLLAHRQGRFEGWAAIAEAWAVHEKRQFEETLRLANEALAIARKENDRRLEAKALGIIGRASRDIYMVKPEKNVPFHEQALEIYTELKDTAAMISELCAIGLSYDHTAEVQREFDFVEKAAALLTPNSSAKSRLAVVRLLGIYLQNMGETERALPVVSHTVELSKALGDRDLTQNIYEQTAGLYMEKNDYDRALAMMDSASAYASFQRELGYFYHTYAEIYEAKGDRQKALDFYKKAFDEQVKGYTDRNAALLTEMETRLRTRETEILLEQQKRQRWLWTGLAAALAALFGGALYAFLKQKKGSKQIAQQKDLIEKQADELRRLDEMKSRFFANVSHELRTPLTLMLGPIGSALKRNRLENQDFTFLKTAQTHGKALLKLVNEILDLTKLDAGKLELHETPVALFPFLRRIVAAFESHAERQGIRFSFQYKAERGLQLELDAPKLETILNNLLSNALKFTPAGGSVSVEIEDLANCLRLTVADTGRGIHPDDLPHVFNRFYQSNQPGASTEGGTGIGLALCRELVELMQGKIWVQSELKRGTSFFVEIPRKEILGTALLQVEEAPVPDAELIAMTEPVVRRSASDTTLLVVEDNASLQEYLRTVLSPHYLVLTAPDGQAALDLLNLPPPLGTKGIELIISDIMMPRMDGFQLLETLKSDDRFRHLPVVMLTARADAADRLRALRTGVDDYLLKPFEEDELLARVENLLKNKANRQVQFSEIPELQESGEFSEIPKISENLPATPAISKEDLEWLENLERSVHQRLADSRLTADTLADSLAMSRAQFFRQIKRLTGLTPAQYLDEARFRHARHLLETGAVRSVKSAAFEVGFRQVEHFSRQFKARFGKYPSGYFEG